ncbi:hypothetical protein L6R29_02510 [Myxococcota bacterium]|nr:hypothetical protein [Myxococcota bacterium]
MNRSSLTRTLVLLASFLLSFTFWQILSSWHHRVPPNETVWGLFQGDMPTYLANARATSPRFFHLTYASPLDISPQKHDYLTQLPISLLSLLLKAGLSESQSNQFLTLFFGTLMFFGLFFLIENTLQHQTFRILLFFLLSFGGGLAWLSSLLRSDVGFWAGIRFFEHNYYWWFFNLFRNLLYPLELIHHCIFFWYLLCLINRQWLPANGLLVLALLSNPFLAAHLILIHALTAMFDATSSWLKKSASLPLVLLWVLYYTLLLPSSPTFHSLISQHATAYKTPMQWADLFQAYGFSTLAFLLFLDRSFVRAVWAEWVLIPIVAMALVTFALVHHSRLPFLHAVQPLHFSRGYLFVSLWLLLFSWIEFRTRQGHLQKSFSLFLLTMFLLSALPDNLSFARDMYLIKPDSPLLVWDSGRNTVLRFVKNLPPKTKILATDLTLNRQISAMTDHVVLFGTPYTTPHFQLRMQKTIEFLANGGVGSLSLPSAWCPDLIIAPKNPDILARLDRSLWEHFPLSPSWNIYLKKAPR